MIGLLNVILVLLAATFMAPAVSWSAGRDSLSIGAAIGIVIVALAGYNAVTLQAGNGDDDGH